ncbi:MAG TPA: AI-2E family transporter [Bryobacteraceae bacterium]|nr:AI-2E family transporter [Bryobacteraceae bacterium]
MPLIKLRAAASKGMGVGSQIVSSLGAYVKAQFQNAIILILLYVAGFAIAGVPWWLLTGILCGLLNLIPQVGSILALGLALLLQFLFREGWEPLAYAGIVWLVIQVVDGFVLSPRAAGRSGVNPFASIILVLVAGFCFGPLGMILAVPVAAVLLIVIRAMRSGS